jgi:hypothetical protein
VPAAEHLGVEPGALLDIADRDAEMRDGSDRDHHRPSRLRFAVSSRERAYAILRNAVHTHPCLVSTVSSWPGYAAIRSIRLGSLFLTFPTRALTGQQIISSDGNGASSALREEASAGSSPSQTGQVSGLRTTGIRL